VLLTWRAGLDLPWREGQERRAQDRVVPLERQAYGRDGTVAPAIAGHIVPRRRTGRKKTA
jgi:hypothetical protein